LAVNIYCYAFVCILLSAETCGIANGESQIAVGAWRCRIITMVLMGQDGLRQLQGDLELNIMWLDR
jgi:hypothetical protein